MALHQLLQVHQILLHVICQNDLFYDSYFFFYALMCSNKKNANFTILLTTQLLTINKSLKRLDRLLTIDLKNLTNWFNANKLSLNVSKTELIIFKPKRKFLNINTEIKLNGKICYLTDSMNYLGVKINSKLNWKGHVTTISAKLD